MKLWNFAFLLVAVLFGSSHGAAQDVSLRQGFGVFTTFAPDSSHILIGAAEKRRVWTVGAIYSRTIHADGALRFDYEGTLEPFFQERDPTLVGTTSTLAGFTSITPLNPTRVVYVNSNPVGTESAGGGASVPIYPLYGSESTYAFAASPLGVRAHFMSSRRLQTSLAVNLGFVVSSKDLPIDNSSNFNYQFSFGPGIEYFISSRESIRAEYVYRHMSNANAGATNPGVDAGVIRFTFNHHRR